MRTIKGHLLCSILVFIMLLSACSPQTTMTVTPPETLAAPTIVTAPPPTATSTTEPEATATREKPEHSIVFILWDGGRADLVYDMMEKGSLPNFAAVAAQGIRAEYARSIDPPLTAAAQNSIATGSYPSHTGIVSNSFHNPTDSFYWYRRGFDELLDNSEPVWVTASRAGLTTAAIFFVGGTPLLPGQTADYTIGYGIRDAYSLQVEVPVTPQDSAWDGNLPTSFSPPYEGSFNIREVARVYLYVLDSSDDNQTNYDTVIINTARKFDPSTVQLKVGEWGPVLLMPRIVSGADFLIQKIDQESNPQNVTLFYSNVYHNTASPRHLLEALNAKFGFFPAGPDSYAIEHGWITPEENLYLFQRASLWMAEVSAWIYSEYRPDLLFTWQDGFDSAGHSYYMVDERQLDYSPENAARYADLYKQAVQYGDQALGVMLDAIDLTTTTLMMAADHGMAPLHTIVYPNTVLEQAGLLTLDSQQYVIVNKTKAFAIASGGSVNIYINLIGHERAGTVSQDEYSQIQTQIIDLFSSITDPLSGEKVFQRVLRQDELAALHLDHLNSGDVFAQAYPGYHLDGWRGNDFVFEQANFYGQHGHISTLPEMLGIFIAAGFKVPTGGQIIPPVQIVDYAPTIAALLGFTPAPTVDGQPIPALMQDH